MSDFQDSVSYKQIRLIAVNVTVEHFKENGSYIGIALLQKTVRDVIVKEKSKGRWNWSIPDELTTRRRINECQSKTFNAPFPAPLVCLGEKRFLGDTDSCYIPALHSVPEEYRQHLSEFLPQGQQTALDSIISTGEG